MCIYFLSVQTWNLVIDLKQLEVPNTGYSCNLVKFIWFIYDYGRMAKIPRTTCHTYTRFSRCLWLQRLPHALHIWWVALADSKLATTALPAFVLCTVQMNHTFYNFEYFFVVAKTKIISMFNLWTKWSLKFLLWMHFQIKTVKSQTPLKP